MELISNAYSTAAQMLSQGKKISSEVSGNYPFEIENGYSTGYEMLHGTQYFSYATTGKYDKRTDSFIFSFSIKWFDTINPNHYYGGDTLSNEVLQRFYKPKDYNVEIKWTQNISISRTDVNNNNINGKVISNGR